MDKAGISLSDLSPELFSLVGAFEQALVKWEHASPAEQADYYPMLEKSDAYISACIYGQFQSRMAAATKSSKPAKPLKADKKARLLALKEQALKIDLNF